MGWLTPKYPEGAEPAKEPSRREKKAAAEKADRDQARAEGWIVPEPRRLSRKEKQAAADAEYKWKLEQTLVFGTPKQAAKAREELARMR